MTSFISKLVSVVVLAGPSAASAAVIYDFVGPDSTALGSLSLDDSMATTSSAWGPNNSPLLLVGFEWFDDSSGIASSGTGLFGLGRYIPGAVSSASGSSIDAGRIAIDTNQYQVGIPGNFYAPLAYDIFPTSVARMTSTMSGYTAVWNGTWIARPTALHEPASLALATVGQLTLILAVLGARRHPNRGAARG
jgi:hypothetical protein